jgi:hypothetical protein
VKPWVPLKLTLKNLATILDRVRSIAHTVGVISGQ